MSPQDLSQLRWKILQDLEGYEGDSHQLSCNIPAVLNEALREFADSFSSPKITKSHIVSWVLLQFAKDQGLIPSS